MTSSLVGSEMCIRDSVSVSENRARNARSNQVGRGWRGASCPIHTAGYRAVSYTHLTLPTICSV
eukprot:5380741-Prorocentrum_lima.AAC.1